ncbi:MAG: hypothetical protein JJT95_12630 [Pararhodobacter sp.]|nr:hypothetical protein [Pararhodobacter sp.]
MAAWRSAPDSGRELSFADWAIASVAVWLGALPLGAALVALAMAISAFLDLGPPDGSTHPLILPFVIGYILFFSPMFSWIGLLLALPPVLLLLRKGAGGWASFALLGAVAGTLGGLMIPGFVTLIAAIHGTLAALAFRWILKIRRPTVFHAH